MDKKEATSRLARYPSILSELGVTIPEAEGFIDWFYSQGLWRMEKVSPADCPLPKSKQLIELAAAIGLLHKGHIVACPVCGTRTGGFMDIDRGQMPDYSRCCNAHTFHTMSGLQTSYFLRSVLPHTWF